MATNQLADISGALSLKYSQALVNQINLNVVLLNLLPVLTGEGKNCAWPVEFSGRSDGAGYTEGADMAAGDYDAEIEDDAVLGWGKYRKGASVSDLALAAAASNMDPNSLTGGFGGDLFTKRLQGAVNRLSLGIGKDLYSGTADIVGLESYVASSGVVATLDPSTYPEWAGVEATTAAATLTFSDLRKKLHTPIYDACGFVPEFCVTSTAVFDQIADLFGPQRRYVDGMITAMGGGPDGMSPREVKFGAGLTGIEVDGITYVRDRHCTANTIYGLNSRFMSIRQLPHANQSMLTTPAQIQALWQRLANDPNVRLSDKVLEGLAASSPGIRPYIKMMGATGASENAMISAFAQLEVTRRNAFGKLTLI